MEIKISARQIELTPAIEQYARKKLEKFPRYFDRIQAVEAIVGKIRNDYTLEIITDLEHHDPIVARCEHEDLYACIDLGVDRAVRQITDHKSRIRDSKHNLHGGMES
jgi:putative sigma-54 modulation protein